MFPLSSFFTLHFRTKCTSFNTYSTNKCALSANRGIISRAFLCRKVILISLLWNELVPRFRFTAVLFNYILVIRTLYSHLYYIWTSRSVWLYFSCVNLLDNPLHKYRANTNNWPMYLPRFKMGIDSVQMFTSLS